MPSSSGKRFASVVMDATVLDELGLGCHGCAMLRPVSEFLPFFARFFLAIRSWFRVLFDGVAAARVERALAGGEPERAEKLPEKPPERPLVQSDASSALQLLALLQREGRLIDFLQQDVSTFSDADVGAAARVVHDGCKKALDGHAEIRPILEQSEGSPLTLETGFDAAEIKLTGNVGGSGPYRGVLRHKGWRAARLELPSRIEGHDDHVLAPAEVEL